MNFVGLKPLETDVPLIELRSNSGDVFDLYNNSDLRAVVLAGNELAFEFILSGPPEIPESRAIVVRFRAMRNLRVEQPPDWAPQESAQIEYLLIRRIGPWPRVVFKAGGLDYEFDCGEICLDLMVP